MVELRIPRPVWEELRAALFARRDVETKAFLLARTLQARKHTALLAREVIPVPEEAYEVRTAASIVVRREFVHRLLQRCAVEGLALVEAHTHPWAERVRFSGIDIRSNAKKFRVTERIGGAFRHAALVFGGDESFQGVMWDRKARREVPVERIKIIGPGLQLRYATDTQPAALEAAHRAIYDRQIRALGEAGQQVLRDCTVGIVGTGGLGSIIAQALALLGVGRLILVDPDNLEPSNANRVVAVTRRDVQKARPKVKALASGLRRSCLQPPQIVPIAASLTEPKAWKALLQADVIVGAVDSARVRMLLNVLAVSALTPYLDGGVGIRAENGRIRAGGGQVRVVLPGAGPCLACLGEETRERVLEAFTPEQREEAIARGYIQGEDLPNPQVVFLNGVVGHLLVWELVKLVTGCLPPLPYVYYDLTTQRAFVPQGTERRAECLVCSADGWLAAGQDLLAAFLTRSGTTSRTTEKASHGGNPVEPPVPGGVGNPETPPAS